MAESNNLLFSSFLLFIALAVSFDSQAQTLYKTTWTVSGTIIGSSVAMFGGAKLVDDARGQITLDDLSKLDKESISGFDSNATMNFSPDASASSDYYRDAAWIAPFTLMISGQGRENAKEILIMYTEVYALSSALTSFTKSAFGRYRPYAYNPEVPIELKLSATTRRSFFSGHVSHVASLSFFTATVFDDLYPESNFRYLVWAGAISAPAITGFLRVKAGRHFPTDVMVGYGVGALIGYFIPELHKITQDTNINIIGRGDGLGLVYTF